MYQHIKVPEGGPEDHCEPGLLAQRSRSTHRAYIEGDGTGFDITPVMIKVVDAAAAKSYGGKRKIHWMESMRAKSTKVTARTCGCRRRSGLKDYVVRSGSADHAGGGGIRSLNVACARNSTSTSACVLCGTSGRAVAGARARKTDMVIFRENRRHLRRINSGAKREGPQADQDPAGRLRRQEDRYEPPASASSPYRRKAPAPGAQGHPVCDRQRQALGDAGAQGQHHESSPKAASATGAMPGPEEFGAGRRRRPVVQVQTDRQSRGQGHHCRRFLRQSCCARQNTR